MGPSHMGTCSAVLCAPCSDQAHGTAQSPLQTVTSLQKQFHQTQQEKFDKGEKSEEEPAGQLKDWS